MPKLPDRHYDFDDIPMGHARVVDPDENGFTTVLRVPLWRP